MAVLSDSQREPLFQTSETAYGTPLVDEQHPHDFVMELSVQYAHPLGQKGTWNVFYAPVGNPALGAVAFPHRASTLELPQAAIGHHGQDSTHIVNNVLTGGVTYGKVRLEASGFHGREPDEARWNIDWGAYELLVQPPEFLSEQELDGPSLRGPAARSRILACGQHYENHSFG